MTDDPIRKRLPISLAVAVFAVLLATAITATSIHPAYADEDCKGDDGCGDNDGGGGNCFVNALGISVCDAVEAPGAK